MNTDEFISHNMKRKRLMPSVSRKIISSTLWPGVTRKSAFSSRDRKSKREREGERKRGGCEQGKGKGQDSIEKEQREARKGEQSLL